MQGRYRAFGNHQILFRWKPFNFRTGGPKTWDPNFHELIPNPYEFQGCGRKCEGSKALVKKKMVVEHWGIPAKKYQIKPTKYVPGWTYKSLPRLIPNPQTARGKGLFGGILLVLHTTSEWDCPGLLRSKHQFHPPKTWRSDLWKSLRNGTESSFVVEYDFAYGIGRESQFLDF